MPAAEMQERMRRLLAAHGNAYPDALKILSMDRQEAHALLNLASELDQALVEQIDAEVIFLDNRSTLVHGGRENEAESWDAMQQWLLRLRRLNKTVLLVDHAAAAGLRRGTSKREDVLDTIIREAPERLRADQNRFEVHLRRPMGRGDDAKPFEAMKPSTAPTTV
jgi:putative DNA primase/helicase